MNLHISFLWGEEVDVHELGSKTIATNDSMATNRKMRLWLVN